jgi:zinc finger protein
VEGLLVNIREKLLESNMFSYGDSSVSSEKAAFKEFMTKLDAVVSCSVPFTLVLDDPMGNAFIHNPYYPEVDPQLSSEEYERTQEQNDDLGLSDINVDHYD